MTTSIQFARNWLGIATEIAADRSAAAGLAARAALVLLAGLTLVSFAAPTLAQTDITLVSNTGQSRAGTASKFVAQSFTTGANADGYPISKVDLYIQSHFRGRTTTVTIRSDVNNVPGTVVAMLTNPSLGNGIKTFTAPSGTVLAANTTYWLYLNDGQSSPQIRFEHTNSGEETGETGWSIVDSYLQRLDESDSWDTRTGISVIFAIKGMGDTETPVIDNTPPTASDGAITTNEDTPYTFAASDFNFTDADDGDMLSGVYVGPPAPKGALTRNGVTVDIRDLVPLADIPSLVFTPVANDHGMDYSFFSFRVHDGTDPSDGTNFMTVNVTQVNDPATGAPTISGEERVRRELTAATDGIEDVDGLPNRYSYQWIRVVNDTETDIAGATDNTYRLEEADQGNTVKVKVSFRDDDDNDEELTSAATGTIAAAPTNTAPEFSVDSLTRAVDENTTTRTEVGAVIPEATDPQGDDLSYSIEGTDAASFNFNVNSRQLYTKSGITYDYEDQSGYSVTIMVSDGDLTDTVEVTINVTDVNEPPAAPAAPSVAATANSTTSLDVNWTAPDTSGQPDIAHYDLQYRVTGATVWTNGPRQVATTSAAVANLTEATGYEVQVRAVNDEGDGGWSESGEGSTSAPANAPPTASNSSVTTDEDTAYTFAAADFNFADTDGNSLSYVEIVRLPAAERGTLKLGTEAVTRYHTVTAADIGSLVFTPPPNANGSSYANFLFHVSDGMDESVSSYTMTVNVTQVNDAATGVPTISGRLQVAATLTASTADFADVDGLTDPRYSYEWTLVEGEDSRATTTSDNTYTLLAADEGSRVFVAVSFTDDDGNREELSTNLATGTIGPRNLLPTSSSTSVTTDEDTSYTFAASDFSFSDGDSGDSLSMVELVTLPTRGTLRLEGTAVTANQQVTKSDIDADKLKFTPASNGNGATYATFTFKVSDGKDQSDSAYTITVIVTAVNDPATGAPGISGTVETGATLTASTTEIADADGLANASYSYQWVRVDNVTETDISGAMESTYTLADADEGKTIKLKLSFTDDEGNSEQLISAATDVVNAPPNVDPAFSTATLTREIAENTPENTAIGAVVPPAADPDNDDTLVYSLEGTDAASFNFNVSTRQLSTRAGVTYDHEVKSSYSVTIRVSDGRASDTVVVTIDLTDVDEPPAQLAQPALAPVSGNHKALTVSWTAPVNDGKPAITGYKVQYRQQGDDSGWSNGPDPNATATSARISDLRADREHRVRVRAVNEEGSGVWSDASAWVFTNPPATHQPPTFPVDRNWTLTPAGLEAGDKFRLLFVTAVRHRILGVPFNIANTGTVSAAEEGHAAIQGHYSYFRALACGYDDTAIANAGTPTSDSSISVYWLGGEKVADNYADLYDGSWDSNQPKLPDGTDAPTSRNGGRVFHGCQPSGRSHDEYYIGIGASHIMAGQPGNSGAELRGTHLLANGGDSSGGARFYGLSPIFQVLASDNNPPEFNDETLMRSFAEDAAADTRIQAVIPAATDEDDDDLDYSMEGTDAASFNFQKATRQLWTKAGIEYDFEDKSSYSVTIKAEDGNGGTDTVAVTINVTDVNEPPAAPDAPSVAATADSTTSLDVSWTAPENDGKPDISGYDLQYRIADTDDAWTEVSQDGTGTSATIADLTASTSYEVRARAVNDEGDGEWSASGTGSTATPDNNAPEFAAASLTRAVAENTSADVNVGDAIPEATDADTENTLTYSLEGTDHASFAFDASTRQIKTQAALDHEMKNSYSVTVKVDDGNGGIGRVDVTISVTDLEEPPAAPAAPSVAATADLHTSLDVSWTAPANAGKPVVLDYDLQYRVYGNATWTQVETAVETTSTAIADLETGTRYEVQVRARNAEGEGDWSDSGDASTSAPANDAPVFPNATLTRQVAENSGAGVNVGAAIPAATDANGDDLKYTMEGADEDSFGFDESTLQFTTSAGVIYDYEGKSSYSVTVKVEDGNGGADTVDVTISLTDVADTGDTSLNPSPADATVARKSRATYSVRIEGDWDTGVTPGGVPANSPHFTTFVGGIHNDQVSFLSSGQTASAGVEAMAELGTTTTLVSEVNAAKPDTDRALTLDNPGITGSRTHSGITFTSDHPRITLTSMIAPSPDWFVGVSGRSLLDSAGNWLSSHTVNLYPWDAGTENGAEFSLSNADTNPKDVISSIRGRGKFTGEHIARLVFTRTGSVELAPAAPAGFAATGADAEVVLAWDAPAQTGITGHEYRYKSDGAYGDWTAIPDSAPGADNEAGFTVTGLTNDTNYTFELRAVNSVGGGAGSAEVSTMPAVSNSAPVFSEETLTLAVAENSAAGIEVGAAVTATDTDDDELTYTLEGDDASSFEIDASTGQISTVADVSYDHEATPSYSVTVRAADEAASDTVAVTINVTDVDEPPDAPSAPSVSATTGSATSLDVSWTAPDNAGKPAVTYFLQYRVGDSGNFLDAPDPTTGTSATIADLAANTDYEVQVMAENDEGKSDWSAAGSGSTAAITAVTLSVNPVAVDEDAGATTVTVTGALDGAVRGLDAVVTVSVGATGDTAAEGADYATQNDLTLTIGAGQTSGTVTFTLTPTDDDVDEADETLTVGGATTASDLSVNAATVTINDNDARGVEVGVTGLTVPEGEDGAYTVVLTSEPTASVTVTPSRASGDENVTVSGALTFTTDNWSTPQTVTVSAAQDTDAEDDTAVIGHTVSGADYVGVTVASVDVTVDDNETASSGVTLTVSPDSVSEGASATTVTVTATLNGGTRGEVTAVAVTVTSDTAISGEDFAAVTGFTITIPANTASHTGTFSLTPTQDSVDEPDEALSVEGSATGLTVTGAEVVITDDDAAPTVTLSLSDSSIDENSGSASVTASLSHASSVATTVTVFVSPDAPAEAADYAMSSNKTLTIAAGATGSTGTVTVTGVNNDIDAADKTVQVRGAANNTLGITDPADVELTLEDDDTRGVAVSESELALGEGEDGTYTVVLMSEPTASVTVTPSRASGDADVTVSGPLTFTATTWSVAQTVTVSAADDRDAADDTATIEHRVTGGDYASADVDDVEVSVSDNETASTGIKLSVNPAAVDEDAGATTVTVTGALDGAVRGLDAVVTVSVGATGDTAAEGADYATQNDLTLTIGAGQTSGTVTFTLTPTDDDVDEADETLTVGGATTASDLSVNAATVTINDNDSRGVEVGVTGLTVPEGEDGAYTVVLTSEPTASVTVTPSRASGDENVTVSGALTFTTDNWSTAQTVTVSAAQDTDAEDDTAVIGHTVSGADYVGVTVASVDVTVDDDETASSGVTLTVSPDSVSEGASATTVTVTAGLNGGTRGEVTAVAVTVTSDTAISGEDFAAVTGFTITIPANTASHTGTFSLTPTQDTLDEPDEALSVEGSATGLTVTGAEVVITDDDPAPTVTLSLSDASISENGGIATITALLNHPSSEPTTVTVSVAPDAPATSSDYSMSANAALTIAAGATGSTGTVTVTGVNNDIDAADKTVQVRGAANNTLGITDPADVGLTLEDDDTRGVAVSRTELEIDEEGDGEYTVALTSEPAGQVTVTPVHSEGDSDVTVSGELTFSADNWSTPQTVTVSAAQDTDAEDDTAVIGHTVSGADYVGVTAASVDVTVDDNETASSSVTLTVSPDSVSEGAGATTVTVTAGLNGGTRGEVTAVAVTVTSDTAISGEDFAAVTGFTITIPANTASHTGTFSLTPTQDSLDEPDEALSVEGSATGLTVTGAEVVITDDDPAPTVTLSLSDASISENGGIATITALLNHPSSEPTTVTVSVAPDAPATSSDYSMSANAALTIAAGATGSTGTVTVTGVNNDIDAADKTVQVRGAANNTLGITDPADVGLTLEDDDTRGVAVSESELALGEGEDGAYTVVLMSEPTASVTVTPSRASGDENVTVSGALTFTTVNWGTAQTVTVSAAQDTDALNDEAVIGHTVSGADYVGVTAASVDVTVDDDETASSGVSLSLSRNTVAEGAGATGITVTATLNGGTRDAATPVTVTVASGAAESGTDFAAVTGFTITIPANTASHTGTFSLTPTQDTLDEPDEALSVGGSATGLTVTGAEVVITDDDAAPTVTLSLSDASISENGGIATITALLNHPSSEPTTVTVSVAPDAPATSSDYSMSANAALTIAAGATGSTGTVTVTGVNNDIDAADKTVQVRGAASNILGITDPADVELTLEDDDTRGVAVSESELALGEGEDGAYTVVLTSEPTASVTVTPSRASGDENVTVSGALTFTTVNWGTAQTVTVSAAQDTDALNDEAVIGHTVSGADYVGVTAASVDVSVDDDETASSGVTLTVSPDSVSEGASATTVTVTATLNGGTRDAATPVTVTVASGTAESGTDFAAVTGFTITIPANTASHTGTFSLTPTQDTLDEPDETVTLAGTVTGLPELTVASAQLEITDDDAAPTVTLSLSQDAIGESGGVATVTAELSHASSIATTVTVSVEPVSPATASDFSLSTNRLLTISAGDTAGTGEVTITGVDNDVDAPDKTVTVKGVADNSLGAAGPDDLSLTLEDDDERGVALDATTLTVPEGDAATYTIVLISEPTADVTVTPARASGAEDVTVSGALTFTPTTWNAPQTVTVSAAQDTDALNDEAVIGHTVSGADYVGETVASVDVTVDDDETASSSVTLTVSPDSVSEGAGATSITVTATLNGGTRDAATPVTVTVASGAAESGTDFAAVTGFTITIPANTASHTGTFSLTPTQDTVDEPDEALSVEGSATGLTVTGAEVVITDDDAAPTVTLSLSDASISENGGIATITALLNHPSSEPTTVTVSVAPDAPATSSDYSMSANAALTIAAGATGSTGTVTVTGVNNDVDAPDKTVTVKGVADNSLGAAGPDDLSLTLEDDDERGVALDATTLTVPEGDAATYTIVLISEPTADVTVTPARASGAEDVTVSGALTFTPTTWNAPQTVTVSAAQDTDALNDEAVIGHTVSGADYVGETVASVDVTVDDDETASSGVTLTVSPDSVSEGASATTVTVTATLNGGTRDAATPVTVTVASGTAESGTDFAAVTGFTITIPANTASHTGTFSLTPTQDTLDEPDETVTLAGTVTGLPELTVASAQLEITDDDAAPTVTLSLSQDAIGESGGVATVTAELSHASSIATTVTVSVEPVSPATASDFSLSTNRLLTISAGDTAGTGEVTITGVDNDVDAPDKTVTVKGVADNSLGAAGPDDLSLTLEDDDERGVALDATTLTVPEGDAATYTIMLISEPTADVTVTPARASGAEDVTVSGALTFTPTTWNAPQTVTVSAAQDTDALNDEAVIDHTVSGADYVGVTAASVDVTVDDDETASSGVSLSLSRDTVAEGAGATAIDVVVTLDGAVRDEATPVSVTVDPGTATAGADFAAVTGFTVTVPPGAESASGTFTLTPTQDEVDEEDETVLINGATTILDFLVTGAEMLITDDDEFGVALSTTTLTVPEGDAATYTIVLNSEPTVDVTVTPSVVDNPELTVSEALTFTPLTWNSPQTVTVSAPLDANAVSETAVIEHVISGGEYGSEIVEEVVVTVSDDGIQSTRLTLTVNATTVDESDGATIVTVTGSFDNAARSVLTTVSVSVGISGDVATEGDDYEEVDDRTLIIDAGMTTGAVTFVLASADDKLVEGDETLTIAGSSETSGLNIIPTTITIIDNDERGVLIDPAALTVPEGGSASYTLALTSEPGGNVTVTPSVGSGEDVSVSGALTFTSSNWDQPRTVTVSAAHDDDADDGSATIAHAVAGADYGANGVTAGEVSVAVDDDETTVALSIDPAAVDEDGGAKIVTVTGRLDGEARTGPARFTLIVGAADDGAVVGADYAEVDELTLTIPAGQTSGAVSFSFTPVDDSIDERVEAVSITATSQASGVVVSGTIFSINDNDERGLRIGSADLILPEGGTADLTVALITEPTAAVTVTPSVSGDGDVSVSGALTFTADDWDQPQTVTVSAAQDEDAANDAAAIELAVAGADYGANGVTVDAVPVLVDDDEAALTLTLNPAAVAENGGGVNVTVTGTLDGEARAEPTTLALSVGDAGDTAVEGTDYAAVDDLSLTIPAGQTTATATFTLTPTDDSLGESGETLTVAGSTAANGLRVIPATVTINDNDERGVTVSRTGLTLAEGESGAYTVVLDTMPTAWVLVTPTVSGSSDLTVTGALTFTPNNWSTAQTVTVSSAQDADAANDTAVIGHAVTGADYGANGVTAAELPVTVEDNEAAVTLMLNPAAVNEDGGATAVTVTATLNGATRSTATTLTLGAGATGDAAVAGVDYAEVDTFSLTILAGQTSGAASFTLRPTDDLIDEPAETLSITGTSQTAGIAVTAAALTVNDNDERGIAVSPADLTVTEGESADYTVALTTRPTAWVVVTPSLSGSPDLSFSPSSLTFTPSNWSTAQTVTVSATEDEDAYHDSSIIGHVAQGVEYESLTDGEIPVTISDDEAGTAPRAQVTGLRATGTGNHVDLRWTAPADTETVLGYRIETSYDQGANWAVVADDTGSAATAWRHNVGLDFAETRRYRVSALIEGGVGLPSVFRQASATSSIGGLTATALSPANATPAVAVCWIPRGVTAAELSAAAVSWAPVQSTGATDFSDSSWQTVGGGPAGVDCEGGIGFRVTSISENQRYAFRMRAKHDGAWLVSNDAEAVLVDASRSLRAIITAGTSGLSGDSPVPARVCRDYDDPATPENERGSFYVSVGFTTADAEFLRYEPITINPGARLDIANATWELLALPFDSQFGFRLRITPTVWGEPVSLSLPADVVSHAESRVGSLASTEFRRETADAVGCETTISEPTRRARVTDVQIEQDGNRNGEWTTGELIRATLGFDEQIDVVTTAGVPGVTLAIGAVEVTASFARLANGDTLIFERLVTAAESPLGSVTLAADSLALNGGEINSFSGPAVDLAHAGTTVTGGQTARADLTAGWSMIPGAHEGGGSEFETRLRFSEDVNLIDVIGERNLLTHAFTVTNGSMTAISPARNRSGEYVADEWVLRVAPDSEQPVTISPAAGRACGQPGAICAIDDRQLSAAPPVTVHRTEQRLTVADAEVGEGPGAVLEFAVTLSRAPDQAVSVDYATADGTATAGEDYEAVTGTLSFVAGQTTAAIKVSVIDDSHDEGEENLSLVLSNAVNARLHDGEATGYIVNSDPMPGAWLSRFGRTASDHVAQAVSRRLDRAPTEQHLKVGSFRLDNLFTDSGAPNAGPAASMQMGFDPMASGAATLSATRGGDACIARTMPCGGAGAGAYSSMPTSGSAANGSGGSPAPDTRPNLRDALLGSSFFYTYGDDDDTASGPWTAWGETASTRFQGSEGTMSLNGDVTTAIMGLDKRYGRLLLGSTVSYSVGEGGYRDADALGGSMSSALTSLNPYALFEMSEKTSLWGVIGFGRGQLQLAPKDAESTLETELSNHMAAFGGRTALSARSVDAGQFELAIRSDALLTSTNSKAVRGLSAAQGSTSRVRVLLEGSGAMPLGRFGLLSPTLEAGLRYDGGDAETGAGFELGGGLGYAIGQLQVQFNARTLLAHEDAGYEEWGVSSSIQYQPGANGQGLLLRLGSAWGADQSGVQSMWSRETAQGLAQGGLMNPDQRYQAEFGYGVRAPHREWLWYPYIATESSGGSGRALRLGLKLSSGAKLETGLEFGRRPGLPGQETERAIMLEGAIRW